MVKSIFARPVNALVFHAKGEVKERIGDEKRTTPFKDLKSLEDLIIGNSVTTISADVTPMHPPFFTEFSYTDIFGGYLVTTLSAEINFLIALELGCNSDSTIEDLFKSKMADKYVLQSDLPSTGMPEKVIFMTGSNLFHRVVDTNKLDELMLSSDDWYLKPHPLTNDAHMKEYGFKYGYGRIIDKAISGHSVYKAAKQIASVNSSEITLRSILDKKPCVDLTAYSERYTHSYACYIEAARQSDAPADALARMLSDRESGFLFPELSHKENIERLLAYQRKALKLRERFKMRTNQKLAVIKKPEPVKR